MKYLFLILFLLAGHVFADDDNPGHLDNPAAIALVQAQLKANDQDPAFFDIKYVGSEMLSDGNGATQTFSIINKKTGHAYKVVVAIHWEEDASRLHTFTMPTHPPQASVKARVHVRQNGTLA